LSIADTVWALAPPTNKATSNTTCEIGLDIRQERTKNVPDPGVDLAQGSSEKLVSVLLQMWCVDDSLRAIP